MMKWVVFLGSLAAVLAMAFSPARLSAQSSSVNLTISQDDKTILVKADDREVLEYRCAESPNKPYLRQLFSPNGVQILRDSPSDHKHHHALMFAVKADNVDFWGEKAGDGVEKSLGIESMNTTTADGVGQAELVQKIDWIDPQKDRAVLRESRRLEAHFSPELKATLISWHTTLEPAEGKESVVLGGEHYFGLGMRFVESMDAEGDFLNSEKREGESVRGSEKLTPARWCAYRSKADGKPVTVALFDSPKNPRHPNKFFTMRPFAYLAATMNLWKEPMTLAADKPLELTYGIAVWDGSIEPAEIEKTYRQWLNIEKETHVEK
jgi:hypothetical protein